MKIIEQNHEILSMPDNPLELIEASARTCYKSENKIGCTQRECVTNDMFGWSLDCDNTDCKKHSSYKLIKSLIKNKHDAMIEFGDIIVKFITNRSVTHELVRHRLCSFAQESTRYVRYDGSMEFIRPVWWFQVSRESQIEWVCAMEQAEGRYHNLLAEDWRPEQAREVLPNSLKTEIVVKANLREWRHIFQLRCSKKAHPQMRSLMINLLIDLKTKIPLIFDDIEV
jgi:thymidylate synthase (FAD)